ncbi:MULTISPECIES: DUF1905 domain-containing protein [Novosphingobium]|uniref:DUF1905 domain-containing protein n=1 Tax=Novosphingobium mathurense TaxID=428990 RepID=A0A1U6ID13_9SPHN|nr:MULTISPECIES: DUF1905 domain-containing protein [Novosphingobium]CDO35785.1 conserved hypothetical protein [Novosphingobium sp. KN65.2]SLK05901.1 protein of unknown function [Novosphingobium mathurense]
MKERNTVPLVETLTHVAQLWRWTGASGAGTWHFLTIDGEAGDALSGTAVMRKLEGTARGFGSLKVKARIGASEFATSVFPSKSDGGWLLPIKAAVRKAEGLAEGDSVEVMLEY